MCLVISHRRKKIATRDIPVYKVIRPDNRSFIRYFKYKRRTLYTLEKPLRLIKQHAILEGFHAYRSEATAFLYDNSLTKIVRFKIPKGATYFEGIGNEIVSNQIYSGELRPLVYKR